MRLALFMLVIAPGLAALGTPAAAQSYPWCAIYSKDGGGQSCSFSTRDQCLLDVSGIGGFCEPNNLYVPGAAASSPHRHARQKPNKNS